MERAHGRQPGIHGDEQIQGLGLADLSDEQAVRTHAQRLLDQTAQADLAHALQVRGPGLHGDAVPVAHGELEDLLARDHALAGGNGPGQRADHGGLAGLGGARDDDVEAGLDGGVEEGGRTGGQGAQANEIRRARGPRGVLADIDSPVAGGDRRDDDVKTLSPRQLGVHEGGRQIQPAPRDPQHALDQDSQLLVLQDRGGQFRPAGAGHEDAPGRVAPDLLDRVVVEVALERSEARQGVDGAGLGVGGVVQGRDEAGVGAGHVVGRGLGDEALQRRGVGERVDASTADEFTDLIVQQRCCVHGGPRSGQGWVGRVGMLGGGRPSGRRTIG